MKHTGCTLCYLEKCGHALRDAVALSRDDEVTDNGVGGGVLVLGAALLTVGVLRRGSRLVAPVFSVVLSVYNRAVSILILNESQF